MVTCDVGSSKFYFKFQSDILDVDVDRPKIIEVTALGAAFLAGIKASFWTYDTIEKVREREAFFTPKMENQKRIQKYKGWQKAVERTKSN